MASPGGESKIEAPAAGPKHPLDEADIECLIQGLRLVTPCTQRIDRLIDMLEQIRGGGRQGTMDAG